MIADEKECRNCKWFKPWKHNRIGYLRGSCNLHIARRIPDGFIIHLPILGTNKFVCDNGFEKLTTEYCPVCGHIIEKADI